MAADSNGVDGALKQQLDALAEQVAKLQAANAQARHVRLGLILVTFALCLAIVVSFYRLGNRVIEAENLEQLRGVAEKRLQKRSDDYMRQVQLQMEHTNEAERMKVKGPVKKEDGKKEKGEAKKDSSKEKASSDK